MKKFNKNKLKGMKKLKGKAFIFCITGDFDVKIHEYLKFLNSSETKISRVDFIDNDQYTNICDLVSYFVTIGECLGSI